MTEYSVREQVLDEAKEIVMKDRNTSYGDPEDNFLDIAEFWTTYLRGRLKEDASIEAHDVGAMMILVKCSRIKTSPTARDHYVDAAGYAACSAESAPKGKGEKKMTDKSKLNGKGSKEGDKKIVFPDKPKEDSGGTVIRTPPKN